MIRTSDNYDPGTDPDHKKLLPGCRWGWSVDVIPVARRPARGSCQVTRIICGIGLLPWPVHYSSYPSG